MPSDLERFIFYGRKIIKLEVTERDRSRIDSSTYRTIAVFFDLFRPGCVILPNLRDLCCHDTYLGDMLEIIPYISPNLREFQLDATASNVKSPTQPALAILSALPFKSPFIQNLRVAGYAGSTANKEPILPTFPTGLFHLSTFQCPNIPISHDAIRHLANLPNLYEISLRFSDKYSGSLSTLEMSTTPFPSLRKLTLAGTSFVSETEFIQCCLRSAPINSVDICAEDEPSAGEIRQLFSALSSHIHPQSLTSIRVRHPDYTDNVGGGAALESSDFEPLLSFTNMKLIWIHIASSPGRLSDSLLEAISMAWPQLVALHLDSKGFMMRASQCTLHGILLLAKRCPNLIGLTITFMASTQISWDGRPGEGTANRSMSVLDFGRSPLDEPGIVRVASFLSDIFPNVNSINAWDDYDHSNPDEVRYWKRWQEVANSYGHFVQIRKEERAWAADQGHVQRS
jgi:hypothetical protein